MFVTGLQPGREHGQSPLDICRQDNGEGTTVSNKVGNRGIVRYLVKWRDRPMGCKCSGTQTFQTLATGYTTP